MRFFAPALILVFALAGCGAPAPPEFYARAWKATAEAFEATAEAMEATAEAWKATAYAHKRMTEAGGYGQMEGEDLIAEALEKAAFFTAGAAATRASVAEADSLAAEALDAAAEGRKRLRGGGRKATRKTAKTFRELSEQLRRSAAVAAMWGADGDYPPWLGEPLWVEAGRAMDEAWAAAAEADSLAAEAVDAAAAVLEAEE